MSENIQNDIEKIRQILECSELFLIYYFNNIKTVIDVDYETKLINNEMSNIIKLNKETSDERIKLIEKVESFQSKCFRKRLTKELINYTNLKLNKIDFYKSVKSLEKELLTIKTKLESYFLTDDSSLVLLIDSYKKETALIVD